MILKKKKKNKIYTEPLRKEPPSIYGVRCFCDQKSRGCPYKVGMKWLKSFKSSDLLLWKITPWKKPHEQQFAFYNYQHTQALVKNLFNYCPRSERIAQPLSKLIDFSPLPEELYNYKKTETLLIILQNLQFVLSCVWKLTLDQAVVRNLSKLFLFINIGQFLDKKNIMISFDFACDITF